MAEPTAHVTPAGPAAPRKRLSFGKKVLFALIPLGALFVTGEVMARGFRADKGISPFMSGSYRDLRIDLIRRGYPAAHDPLLGYIPRPLFHSDDNPWGAMVTVDEHGVRQNGAARPAGDTFVLAVGDSFTFGDQVGDRETWPAQLEQKIGKPVLNGGVFGYSFAQTVLRAEQMLDRYPVERLVLAYIPDDLARCEQSRRFTAIPWYALENDALVLRGVPVPDSAAGTDMDSQYVRRLLGYSALLDTVIWNIAPHWWVSQQREIWVHEKGVGVVIAEKLLDRLAKTCRDHAIKLTLVLQGHWQDAGAVRVLEYGKRLGADGLDLCAEFHALAAEDSSLWHKFFAGHMSAAGNEWVATRIAELLGKAH